MVIGELRTKIDKIWDTIWTGGISSPTSVLEQITYLMFMKLLDDNQLKAEANANVLGVPLKNNLKDYRARLGVNQQEMGKLAGVSRQTISQIERGDYSPSVTLALKLAKLCNVTVEDIFEYEEDVTDEE